MHLRTHDITLRDRDLVLRPLTESDWPLIAPWYRDPEVLFFSEGDAVASRDLHEVQAIFRHVSQTAFVFVIVVDGAAIGDAWLQDMNLDRILSKRPGQVLKRIDITIGNKAFWSQGFGSRAISMLTTWGFARGADAIFGCDINLTNPRSQRAFEKCGYRTWASTATTRDLMVLPPGTTASRPRRPT